MNQLALISRLRLALEHCRRQRDYYIYQDCGDERCESDGSLLASNVAYCHDSQLQLILEGKPLDYEEFGSLEAKRLDVLDLELPRYENT